MFGRLVGVLSFRIIRALATTSRMERVLTRWLIVKTIHSRQPRNLSIHISVSSMIHLLIGRAFCFGRSMPLPYVHVYLPFQSSKGAFAQSDADTFRLGATNV
jgi:hypothetical protein